MLINRNSCKGQLLKLVKILYPEEKLLLALIHSTICLLILYLGHTVKLADSVC